MKMYKMKAKVSSVDSTDGLGAAKIKKPCQQLCHRELVSVRHEYNYDHAQGNNLSIYK